MNEGDEYTLYRRDFGADSGAASPSPFGDMTPESIAASANAVAADYDAWWDDYTRSRGLNRHGLPAPEAKASLEPAASDPDFGAAGSDERRANIARLRDQAEYVRRQLGDDFDLGNGDTAKGEADLLSSRFDAIVATPTQKLDAALARLAARLEPHYRTAKENRGIGEVFVDGVARAVDDTRRLAENIYNLGAYELGGRTKERMFESYRRSQEEAERWRALHPAQVESVTDIDGVGSALTWATEKVAEQSVNLVSGIGAGMGARYVVKRGANKAMEAALKRGLEGAARKIARDAAARAATAGVVAGRVSGAAFNLGDVAGTQIEEAEARGGDPSLARTLAETGLYMAIDEFGGVQRALRRAGGADMARLARKEARDDFLVTGRGWGKTLRRAAAAWAKDALGEGAGEALQSGVVTRAGNLLQYGTALMDGEKDWRDAARAALEEFAAGAVVGGATGALSVGLTVRDQTRQTRDSDAVLARYESAARDAAASESFQNLEAYDRVLAARAINDAISARQAGLLATYFEVSGDGILRSRQESRRADLQRAMDETREAMTPAAREWMDKYLAQFETLSPEQAGGGAPVDERGFPTNIDLEAIEKNRRAEDVGQLEDDSGAGLFYTDQTEADPNGSVAFEEFVEDGEVVIRVRPLAGVLPDFGGNEFHASDYEGTGAEAAAKARSDAMRYAAGLKAFNARVAEQDAQIARWAQDYVERNAPGAGRRVFIVRNAEQLRRTLAELAESGGPDLRAAADSVLDDTTPDGFRYGDQAFADPDSGVIAIYRSGFSSAAELGALLDHEGFHQDFGGKVRAALEAETGARANGTGSAILDGYEGQISTLRASGDEGARLASRFERDLVVAGMLGVDAPKKSAAIMVSGLDAFHDDVVAAEERLAYAAERTHGGAQLRLTMLQRLAKADGNMVMRLGARLARALGRPVESEQELADYVYNVTMAGKARNAGNGKVVFSRPIDLDAKVEEEAFRREMGLRSDGEREAAARGAERTMDARDIQAIGENEAEMERVAADTAAETEAAAPAGEVEQTPRPAPESPAPAEEAPAPEAPAAPEDRSVASPSSTPPAAEAAEETPSAPGVQTPGPAPAAPAAETETKVSENPTGSETPNGSEAEAPAAATEAAPAPAPEPAKAPAKKSLVARPAKAEGISLVRNSGAASAAAALGALPSGTSQETRDGIARVMERAASDPDFIRNLPTQKDRDYVDAIARGDWRTAQRMVDEQAEANGYDPTYLVWRGDKSPFKVLKTIEQVAEEEGEYLESRGGGNLGVGLYFTPERGYANSFGRDGVVRKFYLNADFADLSDPSVRARMIEIGKDILADSGVEDPTESDLSALSDDEWADVFDRLRNDLGKTGIKAKGVGGFASSSTEEVAVQTSDQAKLADLATFDDSGELIPLSNRFDRTSMDIRFSGARSAGAIFGGTVRVRPDGTMDYSMVKDALLKRTRILQGRPEFQFGSERRSLRRTAEIAASMIERDPEGAQALIDRALDAFESGREWVPSDTELAVLFMEEVLREQRVLDAASAVRACEEGRGDRSLVDAQAALAQARADQLEFAQALSMAKSASGRALSASRIMISDDYSFGGVVDEVVRRLRRNRRLRGADGRTAPLTTEEAAQIESLVKRVQDLSDAKEKAERELKHANARIRGFEAAARQRRVAEGKVKRGERPATVEEAVAAIREKLADSELEMLDPVDLTVWPELWARMNRNVKILADAVLGEMSGRGGDLTEEQYDAFLRRLHGAVTEAYADVGFVSSDPAHGALTVEDVRDMFCDYGDPDRLLRGEREPSDALSALRSRMRSLSKLRAELERVVSGEIPLKAFDGGRFKTLEEASAELERVKAEMRDAFRQSGLSSDYLHRMRTPVDRAKARISARMEELRAAIAAKEAILRGKPVPLKETADLNRMREELKVLQEDYALMLDDAKTDDQRIDELVRRAQERADAAERSLLELKARGLGRRHVRPADMNRAMTGSVLSQMTDAQREALAGARRRARDAAREARAIREEAYEGGRYAEERALEESIRRREERARQWNEAVAAGRIELFDPARSPRRPQLDTLNERWLAADRALRVAKMGRDRLAAKIEYERLDGLGKAISLAGAGVNMMRQLLASGDMSAIGVQCAVAVLSDPKTGAGVVAPGVKAFWKTLRGDDSFCVEFMQKLKEDPDYARLVQAGLGMAEINADGSFANTEEMFRQGYATERLGELMQRALGLPPGNAAQKWGGRYLKASEAAFNLPANAIRFALAKRLLSNLREARGGSNASVTDAEVAEISRLANAATGRGDWFGHGEMNSALSKVLWAPARVSGQLQSLALPLTLLTNPTLRGAADLRGVVARELIVRPACNYAAALLLLSAARALFRDKDDDDPAVVFDPLSGKFLKVKIGSKYVSLTGNLESYLHLAAKCYEGARLSGAGNRIDLRSGFGGSPSGEVFRFFKNKLTPHLGMAFQLMDGSSVGGEPIHWRLWGEGNVLNFLIGNSVIPLTYGDIAEAWLDVRENGVPLTAALSALAFVGMGGSDYGETPFSRDRDRIEAARKAMSAARDGVEGADARLAELMRDRDNARYLAIAVGTDPQSAEIRAGIRRVRELRDAIKNGEATRKGVRILSRRKLSAAEERRAEREADALEVQVHKAVWSRNWAMPPAP